MILFLILFLISAPIFAQEIERIDNKSYVVQMAVTKNIDDQAAHCAKLEMEIERLTSEQEHCLAEIEDVQKQPVPDIKSEPTPAEAVTP